MAEPALIGFAISMFLCRRKKILDHKKLPPVSGGQWAKGIASTLFVLPQGFL